MKSNELIDNLIEQTRTNMDAAERLRSLSLHSLTWKENPDSWSILECLEHLNLYGDYYLPIIENKIQKSPAGADEFFKAGWLGNYFANSMLPKEKPNKMKTFKDKNPLNADLDVSVFSRFIEQQKILVRLLEQSRYVSMTKVRIPISIAKFIKLRLGDTFRFVINHNIRHLVQIERVQKAQEL